MLYFPNPGHAGDSLISASTVLLMRRLNVHFESIDPGHAVDGEVALLGGGGNFVPAYDSIACAFKNFPGLANSIVMMPHTVRGNEALVQTPAESGTLCCRDPQSYGHWWRIQDPERDDSVDRL